MSVAPAPGGSGSNGWRITRNVVRGVLAAALIVLVVLIVMRFTAPAGGLVAGATETPAATGTPTPTTPTAAPSLTPAPLPSAPSGGSGGSGGGGGGDTPAPPPAATPAFTSFTATSAVECPFPTTPVPGGFEPDPGLQTPPISIQWSSTGAVQAWIGADTTDAQAEPYSEVDTSGSFDTTFFCPDDSITWTVTLVGSDGSTVSQTAEISNVGYTG